ncbi:MAG: pseudaminic acid synthase [Bacteriovoracaceae bacterium]|nr:pseudaminic acid synthase [Bacteriovoracaceae bacterium]
MKHVVIDGKYIGPQFEPYLIAEISANHNGKIQKALDLIRKAKEAGADAVKIQTYTPDTMTLRSDKDDFKIVDGTWKGYTLYDLYKEAHTPWEWHQELFNYAKEVGITIFSSPFDETAVDFLEDLNVPAFKVASFEIVDLPLIEYIAQKNKPIIISTGMALKNEIDEAVNIIKKFHDKIIVLHCISGYPTPLEQSNLGMIKTLKEDFQVLTGLSDHTLGTAASVAGVSLGACLIEKHLIENREDGGPDSSFSLEPKEFAGLCSETRAIWSATQKPTYRLEKAEESNKIFRRSIYFVKEMQKGDSIDASCIKRIRPGYGLPPKYFNSLIGKRTTQNISPGTATSWDLIKNGSSTL